MGSNSFLGMVPYLWHYKYCRDYNKCWNDPGPHALLESSLNHNHHMCQPLVAEDVPPPHRRSNRPMCRRQVEELSLAASGARAKDNRNLLAQCCDEYLWNDTRHNRIEAAQFEGKGVVASVVSGIAVLTRGHEAARACVACALSRSTRVMPSVSFEK